jgi:hypothetical protein
MVCVSLYPSYSCWIPVQARNDAFRYFLAGSGSQAVAVRRQQRVATLKSTPDLGLKTPGILYR